jgi:hypothetical protein
MDKILHFFYHFHALWLQRCGILKDEPAIRFIDYQQNLAAKGENVMNKQSVWMRWLVTGLAVAAIARGRAGHCPADQLCPDRLRQRCAGHARRARGV